VVNVDSHIECNLRSNVNPFYSFRVLKNQVRVRIESRED
jgi:hypothetical protein